MSIMKPLVMKEPLVDACNGSMIMSDECAIIELDLVKMKKEDVEFTSEYELTMKRND